MTPEMWWAAFGWLGSALVVFSLVQTNIVWLRIFNLIGCVLAVIYNTPLAIWPSVGLNGAIVVINAVHLVKLRRQHVLASAEQAGVLERPRASGQDPQDDPERNSERGAERDPGLSDAALGSREVVTVEASTEDALARALLAQRRDEVEQRGGAPLQSLLEEAIGVRFTFEGDLLREGVLVLPRGDRRVYEARAAAAR